MLRKLLVTAAAAAAVSVPLAGVAWADPPSDPGSPNGNGIGQGGVPQKAGDFLTNHVFPNANPNPGGVGPVTPGSQFSQAAKVPGLNTPDAYGQALTAFWSGPPPFGPHTTDIGPIQTVFGSTPPGLATKVFTPGCSHGRSGITQPGTTQCVP
jgi:hypothetical protein